jgi:hypothetical protein
MIDLLKLLGGLLVGLFRSHAAREAEMAFLRQQLLVLKRSAPGGSGGTVNLFGRGSPGFTRPGEVGRFIGWRFIS